MSSNRKMLNPTLLFQEREPYSMPIPPKTHPLLLLVLPEHNEAAAADRAPPDSWAME